MDSNPTDDDGYDTVTGDNLTTQMVPELFTGRPMQSRNKRLHQQSINDDMLNTTLPAQQIPVIANNRDVPSEAPADPFNRLADVIMGMNNKSSAQTVMVRPVSTTTLTFDGKCEKFELFDELFHTIIKMQPDMTDAMKTFIPYCAKTPYRPSANRQTLEDILAILRRK